MDVGSYKCHVQVTLPAGTTGLHITCTTPEKAGVLVDDLAIHTGPMVVEKVSITNPGPYPLLQRAPINPAFPIKIETSGSLDPVTIGTVTFKVNSPKSVENITLRSGNTEGTNFRKSVVFGTGKPSADGSVTITCNKPLENGTNNLWVDVTPSTTSKVGSSLTFTNISAKIGSKSYQAETDSVSQRIGYLLSVPGESVKQLDGSDRNCVSFRIPGFIRTKKGTLIAVFDARYIHSGDLCADIDVAAVRSTDGGQTWTTPSVAMDAGPGVANGCGDPSILQDASGRIWVASLATHFKGGASLWVSKTGQDPNTTGQWEMTYSDDEGKTWKQPHVNITKQIKKDEWHCILAGPGNGITTSKGTIVFPAQIWQHNAKYNCMSTICYSKDGGKTWKYGNGVPHRTSECQVVELKDGSLMLNCRNEARSGKRVVYITKDYGNTWQPHVSNLNTLQEPTCQASLIAGKLGKARVLLFSNPKSGSRNHMTIRYSIDEGKTWSEGLEYDARGCWGYSNLAIIDNKTIGVIYEVPHVSTESDMHGIGFLRIPVSQLTQKQAK